MILRLAAEPWPWLRFVKILARDPYGPVDGPVRPLESSQRPPPDRAERNQGLDC